MKVILFGASGMIGQGVLIGCLNDPGVERILAVGRRPADAADAKLEQIVRNDFFHFADVADHFAPYDACFFCLGVSAAGMSEIDYHRLTFDLTIAAAEAMVEANPGVTFCYVSGEGTDSTEDGRMMWARVKGKTENQLLHMPLSAYMFRPGYVHPGPGVRSPSSLYRAVHRVVGPIFPLVKRVAASHVTTTENIGRAMIEVAANGYGKRILENPDINEIAAYAARTATGGAGE